MTNNAPYTATERLYLDKDGNVVKEGDPDRVELLVAAGGILPQDKALQYGLISGTTAETEEKTETEGALGTPQRTAAAVANSAALVPPTPKPGTDTGSVPPDNPAKLSA